MRPLPPLAIGFLVMLLPSAVSTGAAEPVDYVAQIKPLLAEKCYSCHGVLKQESGLRLETRALMMESGVIVPGEAESSELFLRVTSAHSDRMPPPGEGAALEPDQVRVLRRWLDQGAIAPEETPPPSPREHWAFQPIRRAQRGAQSDGSRHPIDALLQRERQRRGLQPVAAAPRSLQLRRLYLDLLGLPPTAEQLRDTRSWEQIVDDLLSRPAYGERWARHWMDVWRYSDWYGLGKQVRYSQKHLWHWRDWIIRSLNADKGYDRMITEMLAGDELAPADPEVLAATGFLVRNYYLFNRTTWLDQTIEHTGKAFLGLTLNCAKCHDHKYDPISQQDYYRFRALFEPHQVRLDRLPGISDYDRDALPRAFDDAIDRPTYLHVRGNPKEPDTSQPMQPGVPELLSDFAPPIRPVKLPPEAFAPGTRQSVQRDELAKASAAVRQAERQLAAARRRLAKRQQLEQREAASPGPASGDETAAEQPFAVEDDFDSPDPQVWKLVGEDWEYRDGALHQTEATRDADHVRLVPPLPRDFQVDCHYTTTGGTTYKSVTFRFDQSEDGETNNFVYTSAHAPGPKVQVALTRDGRSSYPAAGRKAKPIAVGEPIHLRFAVRDTLVNVWLNDEFVLAYRLPDRHAGFFSLSGFDATVAFDRIRIAALPPDVELTAAEGGDPPASDPAQTVELAEQRLAARQARWAALEATIDADRARYVERADQETIAELSRQAARKQRQADLAEAESAVLAAAGKDRELKSAQADRAAAAAMLKELNEQPADPPDKQPAEYASLRGSRKALESPAHKVTDYPATYSPVSTGRRLALARWIISPKNPLTARVAVNHVWMRHFGEPLVDSVFDFGLRAERPRQAALLDELAARLIDSGWSLKQLHRLIVTSAAYRLSSSTREADPATEQQDPENHFYWRANPRRMESQVVRDSLLALAGQLDRTLGGPSLEPGPASRRRSVYFKHSRDQQDKFLSMFDDADILQCYRRDASIVPQQALALSNSELALQMSATIAERLGGSQAAGDDAGFAEAAFFRLLGRPADPRELAACTAFLQQLRQLPSLAALPPPQVRARIRTRLIHALINHNDFVTIR